MKKEEAISVVQNSLGSLFTKDDVINLINQIELQISIETKASYPSKKWLDKIMDGVLHSIDDTDFNDTDMYDVSEMEFAVKYGNQIEIDSYEIDACALKTYVKNEIENYFGGIEDDIIEMQQEKEEEERLNSNEALKEAITLGDLVTLERS